MQTGATSAGFGLDYSESRDGEIAGSGLAFGLQVDPSRPNQLSALTD